MDAGRHLAEVVELLSWAQADDGVNRIRRFKADAVFVSAVAFHGEVAVDACDNHVAVRRAKRAVDHKQVVVADARADHRIALDAHEIGRGGPLHKQLVEVKRWFEVLFVRRGETRHDRSGDFCLCAHFGVFSLRACRVFPCRL